MRSDLYDINRRGTGELMRSSEVAGYLRSLAEGEARDFAESISPRVSGTYASSFQVDAGEEHIAGERRAVAYLLNTVSYAGAVEDKNRVLSRTLDYIESKHG